VNVVGIEGEGARGRVVDKVVGVAVEEDTRRFGIMGVREWKIGEGDGRKWRSAVARRMVGIRLLRVGTPRGRVYCTFMATGKDY
jgi:hypothetical protein